MGEAFYTFLVELFTNGANANHEPDRIVSSGLSNLGMFFAFTWMAGSMIWFTTKSVIMRRTPMVYFAAAFLMLCGLALLGHALVFPTPLQLFLEFSGTVVSIFAAFHLWQRRHFMVSVIYQFKYVVGLLKTLEKLEEVEQER
jgi:hypothetical protein